MKKTNYLIFGILLIILLSVSINADTTFNGTLTPVFNNFRDIQCVVEGNDIGDLIYRFYQNYEKPNASVINNMTWTISATNGGNFVLPQNCYNNSQYVNLSMNIFAQAELGAWMCNFANVDYQCWNGASWTTITSYNNLMMGGMGDNPFGYTGSSLSYFATNTTPIINPITRNPNTTIYRNSTTQLFYNVTQNSTLFYQVYLNNVPYINSSVGNYTSKITNLSSKLSVKPANAYGQYEDIIAYSIGSGAGATWGIYNITSNTPRDVEVGILLNYVIPYRNIVVGQYGISGVRVYNYQTNSTISYVSSTSGQTTSAFAYNPDMNYAYVLNLIGEVYAVNLSSNTSTRIFTSGTIKDLYYNEKDGLLYIGGSVAKLGASVVSYNQRTNITTPVANISLNGDTTAYKIFYDKYTDLIYVGGYRAFGFINPKTKTGTDYLINISLLPAQWANGLQYNHWTNDIYFELTGSTQIKEYNINTKTLTNITNSIVKFVVNEKTGKMFYNTDFLMYEKTKNSTIVTPQNINFLNLSYFSINDNVSVVAYTNVSNQFSMNYTIGNLIPNIVNATISTTNNLTFIARYVYQDIDGLYDNSTIQWYVNDALNSTGNNVTFPSKPLGNTIYAKISSNDGIENGNILYSNNISFLPNNPPNVSPYITPIPTYNNNIMVCNANATDLDNQTLNITYRWFNNNIFNSTNQNITNMSAGQVWICEVSANDNINITIRNTTSTTILATAPTITQPIIPQQIHTDSFISCNYNFSDMNNLSDVSLIEWFYDNNLTSIGKNITLNTTDFSPNHIIYCAVTPSNGIFNGTKTYSQNYTIENYLPTITISYTAPAEVQQDSLIQYFANVSDADNEPVYLNYTLTGGITNIIALNNGYHNFFNYTPQYAGVITLEGEFYDAISTHNNTNIIVINVQKLRVTTSGGSGYSAPAQTAQMSEVLKTKIDAPSSTTNYTFSTLYASSEQTGTKLGGVCINAIVGKGCNSFIPLAYIIYGMSGIVIIYLIFRPK